MKLDLNPSEFVSKDAFVRAALAKARDLASESWEETNRRQSQKLTKEIDRLSKQELARRLLRLMTRPARRRAVIDESMRKRAAGMRDKGLSVREIATELGVSIPSVYNITK